MMTLVFINTIMTKKIALSCILSFPISTKKILQKTFRDLAVFRTASPFTFKRNLRPVYKVPISLAVHLYLCIILRWSDNVKFNLA